jgi:hypothetical protein
MCMEELHMPMSSREATSGQQDWMQIPSRSVDLKNLMLEAMTSSMSTWKRPLESRNINLNSTPSNGVSSI